MEKITTFKKEVEEFRKRENDFFKFGIELFEIQMNLYTIHSDLHYLESDLDKLERIWNIKIAFDAVLKDLYKTHYNHIQIDNLRLKHSE